MQRGSVGAISAHTGTRADNGFYTHLSRYATSKE